MSTQAYASQGLGQGNVRQPPSYNPPGVRRSFYNIASEVCLIGKITALFSKWINRFPDHLPLGLQKNFHALTEALTPFTCTAEALKAPVELIHAAVGLWGIPNKKEALLGMPPVKVQGMEDDGADDNIQTSPQVDKTSLHRTEVLKGGARLLSACVKLQKVVPFYEMVSSSALPSWMSLKTNHLWKVASVVSDLFLSTISVIYCDAQIEVNQKSRLQHPQVNERLKQQKLSHLLHVAISVSEAATMIIVGGKYLQLASLALQTSSLLYDCYIM